MKNGRKILGTVLIFAMLIGMVGCGKAQADQAPADQADGESGSGMMMVNPMQEVTDEDVIREYSYGLTLPEGVDQAETWLISGELLERRFQTDGVEYTARVQKTAAYEDISGMYYEWTVSQEEPYNNGCVGDSMRYIGEEGYIDLYTWYDPSTGASYSLSAEAQDLEGFDLFAIVQQVYPLEHDLSRM